MGISIRHSALGIAIAAIFLTASMASSLPVANAAVLSGLTAEVGNRQVTLSWSADVGGYNHFASFSPGGYNAVRVSASPWPNFEHTFDCLTNGVEYTFTVRAREINEAIEGEVRDEATVTATPTGETDAGTEVDKPCPGPSALSYYRELDVTWPTVADAVGYRLVYFKSESECDDTDYTAAKFTDTNVANGGIITTGGPPYTLTGLDTSRYYFRVQATGGGGSLNSSWSPCGDERPKSSFTEAPRIISITAGDNEIDIAWRSLPNTGDYNMQYNITFQEEGINFPDTIAGEPSNYGIVFGNDSGEDPDYTTPDGSVKIYRVTLGDFYVQNGAKYTVRVGAYRPATGPFSPDIDVIPRLAAPPPRALPRIRHEQHRRLLGRRCNRGELHCRL